MRYQITARAGSTFDQFVVDAESYTTAANAALLVLYPRRVAVRARRQTGDVAHSGVFQGYRHVRSTAGHAVSTSIGGNFHVTTAD